MVEQGGVFQSITGFGDNGVELSEFLDKPRHKDETIDHGNGIIQWFDDGDEIWYKDGKLHRDGDLPAVITSHGSRSWYKNGNLHRDGDKPAIVEQDGGKHWYQHGHLHRDGDKPAVIWANGHQEWYRNGIQYRYSDS